MPEFTIGPLPDAVRRIAGKTPVASRLRTEEWARVPLALRERAQFSAGVESVRLIGTVQEKLAKSIGMVQERVAGGEAWVDRSSFIGDLRKIAQEEGLATGDGSITDVSSRARLGLIYDTQTRQASEFARWKVGQDADVLDAYPAQELVREESREVPRDWRARWTAAGGVFTGGRMVALKSDPIWSAISRFGTPWPPFDFGSGMGVEDVSREEAEAMGLLSKGAPVKPQGERDFNEKLEASVKDVPPEMRDWLQKEFKGQVIIDGDRARWTAQEPPTVQSTVAKALAKRVEARAPKPLDTVLSQPPPPLPESIDAAKASAVAKAVEEFHVLKPDGTYKFPVHMSGPSGGPIPQGWVGNLAGTTIVHNHPSGLQPENKGIGRSLSKDDMRLAAGQKLGTILATSPRRTYSIAPSPTMGWPSAQVMQQALEAGEEEAKRQITAYILKRAPGGKLYTGSAGHIEAVRRANRMHDDIVNRHVAKLCGLQYRIDRHL